MSGHASPISYSTRQRTMIAVGVVAALIGSVAVTSSAAVAATTVHVATITTAQTEIRLDLVTGEEFLGNTNSTHFVDEVENFTDTAQTFGLAADMATVGVEQRMWLPDTWSALPVDDAEAFANLFSIEVGAHSSARSKLNGFLPDWPGLTYGFYRIAIDGVTLAVPEFVGSFATSGAHVPFNVIDVGNGAEARIGQPATFVAPEVYPGVDTQATASGLTPGQQLGLWLSPDIDYFSFIASGAHLSGDAVYAGEGFVAADGTLTATLAVPPNLALGSYQLLVGNVEGRNWPAGTTTPIDVVPGTPSVAGSAVVGPTASVPVVDKAFASTSVSLDFGASGAVTSPGVTTVTASPTGPTVDGFTIPGGAPLFYYLHTTAEVVWPVEVCINYNPGDVGPGPFDIHHFTNGAWETLATGPHTNNANGVVCGMTNSFSPVVMGIVPQVTLTKIQQCLNGGWATSTNPVFTSQTKCVTYIALGGYTVQQVIDGVKKIVKKILHHQWF